MKQVIGKCGHYVDVIDDKELNCMECWEIEIARVEDE